MDKEDVIEVLRRVMDPEHPVSVVDLGLVRPEDITVTEDEVRVLFAPTSPMCPMGAIIGVIIRKALEDAAPGKRVVVRVKPGTHMQEEVCNRMVNDEQQYRNAVEKLAASGLLDQCIAQD